MNRLLAWMVLAPLLLGITDKQVPAPKSQFAAATKTGETKQVPYRLTTTKHVLVRAKLNGQGPYNLVIDTGAPVLILAKKVNDELKIEPDRNGWGIVDKLEFEGGVVLDKANIRFEDLYQLDGMNGLGLAGVEIHGLVGFPILSQFRITYDYAQPKLTWTKVEADLEELPKRSLRGGAPGGLDALGSVMKTVGKLFGMGPPPKPEPRGFLGFGAAMKDDRLMITQIIATGPADHAGLKVEDVVEPVNDRKVDSEAALRKALSNVRPEEKIGLGILRNAQPQTITITCGRGF